MLFAGLAMTSVGGAVGAAKLELLGQPCRAKNVLSSRVVRDRASGKEMFTLVNMNENSGAELIFIDFEANTGRIYKAPAGAGAWGLKEVPGDRLVISTFYDGVFMIFDLKKMEFAKVAPFPGESYIWNMAMGGDGRIYGGTYSGGKLGALDLNTYQVEDCGAPAPPNLYLRQVSPTPSGDILCYFNTEKPTTLLYDPATKKYRAAPAAVSGGVPGIVWDGYFLAGRQAFKGKELEEVQAPWPTPSNDKGAWSYSNVLTNPDRLYMAQGKSICSYKPGDKDLTLVTEMDTRGGWYCGSSSNGDLLGLRGQDYFVIRPGDKEIKFLPIPVESAPRDTLFLRCDAGGTLWGGPTFGQTLWHMDAKTKKAINTATICNSGGEVYDVGFVDGKVYAVSYAGGDIVEYDPSRPWDQINGVNPHVIKRNGGEYIRPEGGVSVGPDGKLYTGWLAKYGKYGGGLTITDPKTGDTELIENPLGEQALLHAVSDGRYVYVGSCLAGNGLPNKKGESARFGVVDPATKKTEFQHEFEAASHVRVLTYDAKSKHVVISTDGQLMLFDTKIRGFVKLPDAPKLSCFVVAEPGDGTMCYGSGKSLVRMDIATGKTANVVDAPSDIRNVTSGPKGELYISCGLDVYAVR